MNVLRLIDIIKKKKGGQDMIRKIQKFGGAMFTPVLLFSFAGVIVGLGTLFTSEVIMGSIAAEGTIWSNI